MCCRHAGVAEWIYMLMLGHHTAQKSYLVIYPFFRLLEADIDIDLTEVWIAPLSNLGFKTCVWIIILNVRSIWEICDFNSVITREVDIVMFDVWFLTRYVPCWKCVNRYLLLRCKIKRHWDSHGCIDTLHRCKQEILEDGFTCEI